MKYETFLNLSGIISKIDFEELQKELPNIEYDETSLDIPYDLNSKEEIVESFIRTMIDNNWNYCYLDSIDLKTKTICICDVESLEDLEDIKNKFDPWIISNYEDLKSDLLENSKRAFLVSKLCKLVPIEKLEELVKEYEEKGNSK